MVPRCMASPLLARLSCWLLILTTTTVMTTAQVLTDDLGCQLVALIPFTDRRDAPPESIQDEGTKYYGYGIWPNQETLEKASFSLMAAAEMAVTHFNNRDTTIVPELTNLGTCNITFPPVIYRDSGYIRPAAVDALLEITHNAATQGKDHTESICAVIGPTHPRSNEGVSAVTENLDIPQLAYSTIDRRLSRREDFPTLARTITSSQDYGFAIANFVQRDVMKRDFLAIIYDASDYGEQYEDPLEDAEDFFEDYSTITEHIIEGDRESIEDSLATTVEDGFHSILLATDRLAVLDDVAEVAEEQGLLGEDYFWMLSGDMLTPAMMPHIRYPVDSPADKLLRGAAVFTNYDPFVYYGESDPFLEAWRKQEDTVAQRLNRNNPINKTIFDSTDGYFQTETPTQYASFFYDSIVLTGISACNAYAEKGDPDVRVSEDEDYQSGGHVAEVFETKFTGASGYVQFSKDMETSELAEGKLNGRDVSGVIFGMYNVRPGKIDENGTRSYELVLTHLYTNDTQVESKMPITGSWVPVEGAEFLFFDGTTNPPMPLKTTAEWNYLSQPIHVLGLFLMSLALVVAIGTGIWVFVMRENRIVKASQPEFLYLLCVGSAMVALSLFFISWDEDKGMSVDTLSAFCSVFPWLAVIGYQVMYLAIFFKLWRLSKLLSMRRQAVRINQVMIPFGAVVSFTIVVLIAWQVLDPLTWNRTITNEDEEGQWISYAECGNENGVLPFTITLMILIAISVFMTGAISWKLKDVQAELAESKWIFFGIFSHIQIWAIGIPLCIILDGVSRDASYLISAALTFIFSVSLVILVIWPKIYIWVRDTYFGGPPKPKMSISVGKSQTVVSGLDAGTRSTDLASTTSMGADRARAEANARRVHALEHELEEMKHSHAQEVSELTNLVGDLRAQQDGTVLDAQVQHAGSSHPPAPERNPLLSEEFAEEVVPTQPSPSEEPAPPEESPEPPNRQQYC